MRAIIPYVVIGLIGFPLLLLTTWGAEVGGRARAIRELRHEAAEAGAGHYAADPLTGAVEFRWGPAPK